MAGLSACGGEPTAPRIEAGTKLSLTATALPALHAAREGRYEAWVIDGGGRAHSLGAVVPGAPTTFESPVGGI
ncbi:MAG: hypothetical protein M3125_01500, partial [Gemmatimonadota bacterium]|nr:hypothetical protein [Gemmatimonadota bacterium]